MSEFKPYRKESRKDWGSSGPDNPTERQIQLGAILRIADATEAMAKRHTELIRDRDYYQREYLRALDRIAELSRRLAAQKGLVTKLKKKLESAR